MKNINVVKLLLNILILVLTVECTNGDNSKKIDADSSADTVFCDTVLIKKKLKKVAHNNWENDSIYRYYNSLSFEIEELNDSTKRNRCDYLVDSELVWYPFGLILDYDSLRNLFKDYKIEEKRLKELDLDVYKITGNGDSLFFYQVINERNGWKSIEMAKATINSKIKLYDNKLGIGQSKNDFCNVFSISNKDVVQKSDTCVFNAFLGNMTVSFIFSNEDVLNQIRIDTDGYKFYE